MHFNALSLHFNARRGIDFHLFLEPRSVDDAANLCKGARTAVRVGGDPVNSLPLDIKALSDDQLYGLIDRLSAEEKV